MGSRRRHCAPSRAADAHAVAFLHGTLHADDARSDSRPARHGLRGDCALQRSDGAAITYRHVLRNACCRWSPWQAFRSAAFSGDRLLSNRCSHGRALASSPPVPVCPRLQLAAWNLLPVRMLVVLVNLIVDLIYRALDPRITTAERMQQSFWRRFVRNRASRLGFAFLCFVVLVARAHRSSSRQPFSHRRQAVLAAVRRYLFGTDSLGRDIASRARAWRRAPRWWSACLRPCRVLVGTLRARLPASMEAGSTTR